MPPLNDIKNLLLRVKRVGLNRPEESNFLEGIIRKYPMHFAAGTIPPALYGVYSFIKTMRGNPNAAEEYFPFIEPKPIDVETNLANFIDNYQDKYLGRK